MPVRRVLPFESVDDRVETDAFERHAGVDGRAEFGSHLPDPFGTAGSHVARLRDEDRTLIALVRGLQQLVERHPAWVAWMDVPRNLLSSRLLPLVVVVEVHADDIQILRIAAKLRRQGAR